MVKNLYFIHMHKTLKISVILSGLGCFLAPGRYIANNASKNVNQIMSLYCLKSIQVRVDVSVAAP